MLEQSLRKLVREEAVAAAIQTMDGAKDQIAAAVREGAAVATQRAVANYNRARGMLWTPAIHPADAVSGKVAVEASVSQLIDARTTALRLSVERAAQTEDAEITAARAAVFAAFILDGTPTLALRDVPEDAPVQRR